MLKPFVASSAEQLEVIASPGREAIIDAVAMNGPCSIPQLAEALGRSRHSLYYHAKALRDCGLLLETTRADEGKRSTSYYDVPGRPFAVSFDLSTESRRQAVLSIARARIRSAIRGFERASQGDVVVAGPARDLRTTHLKGWLSAPELEQANTLIETLIDLFGSSHHQRCTGEESLRTDAGCLPPHKATSQGPHGGRRIGRPAPLALIQSQVHFRSATIAEVGFVPGSGRSRTAAGDYQTVSGVLARGRR